MDKINEIIEAIDRNTKAVDELCTQITKLFNLYDLKKWPFDVDAIDRSDGKLEWWQTYTA